ncbi:plant cysteine oxidase 2-like isoform X1 [Prosopis cineraria]|uniref:plant cysteine oxidase 2-like isoform X1 n=1 Tax=Prosopis cineraria TaxID=364024 RepID=UPI00240F114C|nr:plant cysteine oxidase 2-like isoform X1 [Prosopis cineraria]XP_054804105.1 plant cysteine oxidase 2-like isoform X1 [Prosopis cineraria]
MKNRRRQKKTSSVQKLFKACKEVFAYGGTGIVPPPQDIEKLRSILDAIRPEDVGLKPEMPYFRTSHAQRIPRITYLHIHECEKFSMGIFCLPPSGVIPLHNHPGMTVFSKLLFGTMHIKSYDWAVDLPPHNPTSFQPTEIQSSEVRLAKVKVDADFTAPCNTSILYPADGGNMHCFTAVTACAVLDVLGPPYSDPLGRPCTYYLSYPFPSFSADGVSVAEEEEKAFEWLQESEKPEGLQVVGAMYGGPKIVEH